MKLEMGGSPALVQPVLDRAYFLDDHLGASTNHLRFLGKFLLVVLMLARRVQTVPHLAVQIRTLLDESKKNLQGQFNYSLKLITGKWRYVVQEITRFLKADSHFMNRRPLSLPCTMKLEMGGSPALVQPVLDRACFLDDHLGASTNHLRFLGKFLLVVLMLARRVQTVPHLAAQIRTLLDESKKNLPGQFNYSLSFFSFLASHPDAISSLFILWLELRR